MTHRGIGSHRLRTGQREFRLQILAPVQRPSPALALHQVPAFGQPQHRIAITAFFDEGAKLGIGDQAIRNRMRVQQHAMLRRFIVEGKTLAWVADLRDAFAPAQEFQRHGFGGARRSRVLAEYRVQRIEREQVLDVGQQQFLVLLLVVEAEFQQRRTFRVAVITFEQSIHSLVNARAIIEHFRKRGPRQQAPLRARMHRADRLVIGIEQVLPLRMQRHVTGLPREQELFKEPCGVRKVPLDRAGIRHGLHHRVLGCERPAPGESGITHATVTPGR